MKGKITKLSNNVNALRTPSIEGAFDKMPAVGMPFELFGAPLTPGAHVRWFRTSHVQGIAKDSRGLILQTENSQYLLEIYDQAPSDTRREGEALDH